MKPDASWTGISINKRHADLIKDFKETADPVKKLVIRLKSFYYFFQRPIRDYFLRRFFAKNLNGKAVFSQIDMFLDGQGGLFKSNVYSICNRFKSLKNGMVLVPGVGYGRNILQLASFKPRKIIAFDPLDFSNEWEWVARLAFQRFGTKVEFITGDFRVISQKYANNSFDFIISDAVLMHVRNLKEFIGYSYKILKEGGVFYVSWGPPWFGPRGDMLPWKNREAYNHLLLTEEKYKKRVAELLNDNNTGSNIPSDYKNYFDLLVYEKPFSFLSIQQYLEFFAEAGFNKKLLFVKIDTKILSYLRNNSQLIESLNQKKVPGVDRYCTGLVIWMEKN